MDKTQLGRAVELWNDLKLVLEGIEVPTDLADDIRRVGFNLSAKRIGSTGGRTRAKNMTKAARSESASLAARARWGTERLPVGVLDEKAAP